MVSPEPLPRLQEYAFARRLPFPVLSDPLRGLHQAYGASGTPFTLLIDRDGKVVQALGALTAVTHFDDQFVPRVVRELRRSSVLPRG
jgi:peroxiredoxin